MTVPLVSIAMPTWNRLHFLKPAVESVLAQTFRDWELIIADDGSAAATKTYLATLLQLPCVRVIDLHHCGNPARVRNAALASARGKYVAFLDSDDVWSPTKLEVQMSQLQAASADCQWSYTLFELIDALGNPASRAGQQWPAAEGDILEALITRRAIVALPSVVVRRDLLERAGGFDEGLLSCEDYDLWLRLAAMSRAVVVRERLLRVRRHAEHTVDDVRTFEGWRKALDKASQSPACHELRVVIDVQRARVAAGHARSCAAAGDRLGVWRVIAGSVPFAWRYHAWWSGAVLAIAQSTAPRAWRAMRDRRRRRRSAPDAVEAR